jgi:hypothetical protein
VVVAGILVLVAISVLAEALIAQIAPGALDDEDEDEDDERERRPLPRLWPRTGCSCTACRT